MLTNFPNGVSSFGMPVLGMGGGIPPTTGDVYFVHSGTGNANNTGLTPSDALATIDGAVNKCTASQGDIIIVMPGHAENIAGATSLVVDVAGVSIIGLGRGRNRPVLSFTNTAGRIPVSAANVLIENIVFYSNLADIVSGVTVTGDDVTIRGCEWAVAAANKEFLQMLDIDDGDRVTIEGCKFLAHTTAGTNTGIRFDVAHYLTIRGCEFRGDYTTAAISGTTGTAAASTDVAIIGNFIENVDTTAGLLIDVHDTGTGIVANNRGFTLYATNITAPLDPGNCLNAENYVTNAVDETAAVSPTTAST
ncbi:MAG: hypothetical protein LC121_27165 [Anaerolineae bacterium]|nr:hypothetical protein [Anaerolineae bacterium]